MEKGVFVGHHTDSGSEGGSNGSSNMRDDGSGGGKDEDSGDPHLWDMSQWVEGLHPNLVRTFQRLLAPPFKEAHARVHRTLSHGLVLGRLGDSVVNISASPLGNEERGVWKQGRALYFLKVSACSRGKARTPSILNAVAEESDVIADIERLARGDAVEPSALAMELEAEQERQKKEEATTCARCGTARPDGGSLLVCGGCMRARYCSRDCQREHRAEHKKLCKEFERERRRLKSGEKGRVLTDAVRWDTTGDDFRLSELVDVVVREKVDAGMPLSHSRLVVTSGPWRDRDFSWEEGADGSLVIDFYSIARFLPRRVYVIIKLRQELWSVL